MTDLSKPITCKKCRKPFTRTHHLQKTCEGCRGDKCTSCHRDGGLHSQSCPKATRSTSKRAKKKATGEDKKKAKSTTGGSTPRNGHGVKLDTMLTAEKAKVTDLRERLATAEQRVQIMTELAGA